MAEGHRHIPWVLVLNHFAVPRGQAGGTRHVELFGRVEGWNHLILASNRNHLTGSRVEPSSGFVPVPVTAYSSNGLSRIINWVSFAIAAFWRGLQVGKVDVVYASSPHLLAALAGWGLSVVKRARFVLEVRDLWPRVLVDMGQVRESSMTYRVLASLEAFLYRRAARIVIMAEGSRAALLARGVPEGNIAYIPNGADPSDFEPSLPRAELRRHYGFDKFTAIYAGAHGPANGLHHLLNAADAIRDLDLDVVLVGGGVDKVGLQDSARKRGLDNVRFMDPVAKDEIPDLLHAADLGLHVLADVELFRTAVSPNKVFDYMAAALPVLTNCPGAITQLVSEAACGDATRPDEIDRALRTMYGRSSDELHRLGESGKDWMIRNQTRSAMALRLRTLLDESMGAINIKRATR